jgi:hypothetical protein
MFTRFPRMRLRLLCSAALLAVACGSRALPLRADPQQGPALIGGVAIHKGDVVVANSQVTDFVSGGLSVGVEYQWVLSPEFTWATYGQTSVEAIDGSAAKSYEATFHNALGAEFRYWEGSKYVGVHGAAYQEAMLAKSGTGAKNTQAPGWALGLTGGWEGNSGWLVTLQVDLAQVTYTNAVHGLTGIRAGIGYRWKQQ